MKVGKVDFNDNLANLSLAEFKKFFKRFEGKVKDKPEEVYEALKAVKEKPKKAQK